MKVLRDNLFYKPKSKRREKCQKLVKNSLKLARGEKKLAHAKPDDAKGQKPPA
jgi:hypothetical protein